MDVELWTGAPDAVWQTVTFRNEREARDFIGMCQDNGMTARPAGEVDYRHDFGPFMG